MSSVSTYGSMLAQQTTNRMLQSRLTTLTAENASGTYQDLAAQLGSKMGLLYSLQTQSGQQAAAQLAGNTVGAKLTAMQTALTGIDGVVSDLSTQAVAAGSNTGQTDTVFTNAAIGATGAMNQMLGLMNTQYGGDYVFSGNDSGTRTVASSTADGPAAALSGIMSDAVAANGGSAIDASGVDALADRIGAMFGDANGSGGSNYTGTVYTAQDDGKPVTFSVGGTQTMSYDMKGNSQGFRDILQGMSMMTLLNAPSGQLTDGAKAGLLQKATALLNQGHTELTSDTAVLGATQSRLTKSVAVQSEAASATASQISDLAGIDPYKAATQLTAVQTQLQASYTVTARLSQLSFVDYMK